MTDRAAELEVTMTIDEWITAPPKNDLMRDNDWPYEARRSAAVYGSSAAVLASNYGVSAAEARQLMLDAFEFELERRRSLGLTFVP